MAKLQVWGIGFDGPSGELGAVDVRWCFRNLTRRAIRQAYFWFEACDEDGTALSCLHRGSGPRGYAYGRPVAPRGWGIDGRYREAWYNADIRQVRLLFVELEYGDGSEELVTAEQIRTVRPAAWRCAVQAWRSSLRAKISRHFG